MTETIRPIRDTSLYVSWDVRGPINDIARALGVPPDQLAEDWLMERLQKDYEPVLTHHDTMNKAKKAFQDALKAKLNPLPM